MSFERDLRLDLFRGIGLWMIFPDDFVAWLTLRNYGFSDAAEFFMFISGYLAGYIYGPIVQAGNFLAALKRLWTRVWQMYVAHIMLFLLFTAQIARTVRKFDNPNWTLLGSVPLYIGARLFDWNLVRWFCAGSIRCRFFALAYSCPLERIGFWFSTPRAARARSGCNCSSVSAAF
jgi:hypothetical protein